MKVCYQLCCVSPVMFLKPGRTDNLSIDITSANTNWLVHFLVWLAVAGEALDGETQRDGGLLPSVRRQSVWEITSVASRSSQSGLPAESASKCQSHPGQSVLLTLNTSYSYVLTNSWFVCFLQRFRFRILITKHCLVTFCFVINYF